ncbi:histidine phosphatase superfamily [Rhodofomes roseus]|uniref:Histidine phosphatase superfamily n=1 Tax=Rhodofomes roseus TaxID=34475 RepID=A0ABQ8KGR7_9APHY|nr:histidine phosphatase superfamily [Rhodofomes roseus]KAH9837054.1 histidine phosphatase superfamily [Rhodofomes roseus]
MISYLLCSALPLALTVAASESASSFAGSTVSDVFPPPGATITADQSYFPDASQVEYAGPTPTGAELEAIATAPAAALNSNIYPLLAPQTPYSGTGAPFEVIRSWGNLSPWFSVGSNAFGLATANPQVPAGCELEQVHLLHRHGARYPTSSDLPTLFAAHLHAAANSTGFSATGPLEFLNTWTYKLGAELLTPFGREQLFQLGVGFRVKYGELLNGFIDLPVFRTTSNYRMVESALNFAAGFFGVPDYQTSYHQEIIIESGGFNSTLSPNPSCPNSDNNVAGLLGLNATERWALVYLNMTASRLQQYVTGLNLNATYIYAMQQLCAYETVALGYSAFCGLFTEEEWRGFDYSFDLDFWYGSGPGNPTAAAQGIGWVQELVARLTKTPLTTFDTSMNSTLDGSNITFPLNQPIYVDASHDTAISTIITALNFTTLAANGPLPIDHIPAFQTYHVHDIAPFATNLVAQVLSCPASLGVVSNTSAAAGSASYIRFLLNDGVVPLTGISHCETPDPNGLCLLDNFIQGMQERIAEVDFVYDCYGNYTAPLPGSDNIIDGRAPQ